MKRKRGGKTLNAILSFVHRFMGGLSFSEVALQKLFAFLWEIDWVVSLGRVWKEERGTGRDFLSLSFSARNTDHTPGLKFLGSRA